MSCRNITRRIYPTLLVLLVWSSSGWASDLPFYYDARMAFLKAGELSLQMNRSGEQYEVTGEFKTSRAMSNYYTWNGIFTAVGKWQGEVPVTTAYMARTTSKDEPLKIVLTTEDSARVLEGVDGNFETVKKPGGIDLISALFFSPVCYQGGQVHDGEDTYQISLRKQKERQLNAGASYYQGEVLSCDYNVRDHKNRKRRVVVSLAEVDGAIMAVQVRAKIPVLPDAIFRLRVTPPVLGEQLAAME